MIERTFWSVGGGRESSFQNPDGVEGCEQGEDGVRLVPLGLCRVLICSRHLKWRL